MYLEAAFENACAGACRYVIITKFPKSFLRLMNATIAKRPDNRKMGYYSY